MLREQRLESGENMVNIKVWSLDVWGHGPEECAGYGCPGNCDGYTVNDRFPAGQVELEGELTEESLRQALLLRGQPSDFEVRSGDGEFWEVDRASDGRPLLQLEVL